MSKRGKNAIRRPKGYNKRTEEQRAYDMAFCTNLFLRGYTYREIADKLNEELTRKGMGYTITFATVYYDLKQKLIEWKRESLNNIDDYITQELKKLDKIETELWEAWEASKSGKKRTKNRIEKGKGTPAYTEDTNETTCGNPRYLDLLLSVQQRRAKMLGFDKPLKVEIPGINAATDEDKPKYNVKDIPDDLLFAVVDKIQAAEYQRTIEEKEGAK